jgi:hypothetical protein
MPRLLVRFLVLTLLPTGAICRGAAVQLGDVALGHFALLCIGVGTFVLVTPLHSRIDRWIEGQA